MSNIISKQPRFSYCGPPPRLVRVECGRLTLALASRAARVFCAPRVYSDRNQRVLAQEDLPAGS